MSMEAKQSAASGCSYEEQTESGITGRKGCAEHNRNHTICKEIETIRQQAQREAQREALQTAAQKHTEELW